MSKVPPRVLLAASGDLRLSANQVCWPAQLALEERLSDVLAGKWGVTVERIHPYSDDVKHGFLDSQRAGLEAFSKLDRKAPLIVAEAVWQYSHHVLGGLLHHEGPILTLANWSGQWPGLVGLLNLNASLKKAGKAYSTLWTETFDEDFFFDGLEEWLTSGSVTHDLSHVAPYALGSGEEESLGAKLASELRQKGAILGVFDEGCMGMYNAIIPDELLFPIGIYKERLSQSALVFEMTRVTQAEAEACYAWLEAEGMTFHTGPNPATDLTKDQILGQCRMYIAAARIADEFGCDALGIQYQQGLKDVAPASDLAEGLLNNSHRPPVLRGDGSEIRPGKPYTHFNEVDECAGVDGLMTALVHEHLGQPVENTLHDLRWADADRSGTTDEMVWVLEISGAAPPAHHVGGFKGTHGYRQPPMYFPSGGATCSGVAKPGEIVWSRIYVAEGVLQMDLGRGTVIELPAEETKRRLDSTTPVWPIMHTILHGVTRNQMMARHASNHIQVAYAHSSLHADQCLKAKAAMAHHMGMKVWICGVKV
ncbi:MAG: hypothetical protein MUC92_13430 [Fimbriimonadaceae bacterium]|jgi:hypothetical protein|nr:hypothetical protein [Fimbriimonadaceae bacterium]